ncbi:MAG: actin-binding WH2 domain-containing protein, partial [Anaerolineae bacterium]
MKNLAIIEIILRDRDAFFLEIRQGKGLAPKMRAMLISSAAFFALYGAVMGSSHSFWQALSSAAKLPLLFLTTLVICAPTLYFFNLNFGSNQSLSQNVALMLTTIAVTSVLLLSFAPVVTFFLLTTSQYQFFKLLNVGVFTISGLVGVTFLSHGMG